MNKKALKEYRIWRAMKSRCYSPSATKGNYKKNNIQVCDRWLHSFDNFIADMGWMPDASYSIERIDNTGDYCPENCQWIPRKNQPKNRSITRWYMVNGQRMCLKDMARKFGIKYMTLYHGLVTYKKDVAYYIPNENIKEI